MSERNTQNLHHEQPLLQNKKFILAIAIFLPFVLFIISLIVMGNINTSHNEEILFQVKLFNDQWQIIYQDISEEIVQKEQKLKREWEQKFQNLSILHEQSKKLKLQDWEDKIRGLLTKYDELEQEIIILKQTNYSSIIDDLEEELSDNQKNIDKSNDRISDLKKTEEVQDIKLRTLVNDNPFFLKTKAHNQLSFVSARQIKCTQSGNLNALLDFPLLVNKSYSLQFQVMYTKFSPNMRLGISPDNQDWTNHSNRFTKYEKGYGLYLADGTKSNNGTGIQYAQSGLDSTGETITVKIDTTQKGSLSYSYGGVDQVPAFENIDFSAVTYYPAVVFSQDDDEIKFLKVEIANK